MDTISLAFFFIFGTIIGSFLNVCVYRYNTGLSIARGRSQCFSCNKTLLWYELVPLLSFVWQRGKCRSCFAPISSQYFLVELITGILFACIAYTQHMSVVDVLRIENVWGIVYMFVASVMVIIAAYDMRHKIIPLAWNVSLALIASCVAIWNYMYSAHSVLDLTAGLIVAAPIVVLHAVSRGRWIGLADAILFFSVGSILGFVQGIHAFAYAFWIGAAVAVTLTRIVPTRYTFKSEIPFGPFIILAFFLAFFVQKDIFGISLLL